MAGKKARSARGAEVDFDILIIKQQMAGAPTVEVNARRDYIDTKDTFRKRVKDVVVDDTVEAVAPPVESFDVSNDDEPIPASVLAAVAKTEEVAEPFILPVAAEVEATKPSGSRKRSG
jgi:hypothetical protein